MPFPSTVPLNRLQVVILVKWGYYPSAALVSSLYLANCQLRDDHVVWGLLLRIRINTS